MTQGSVVLEEVGRFTDQQLIARLRDLVRADQTLGARLLVHLGEVDARGLYREQACSSMFAYCVEALHMSEAQAYLRIQAARLGRQFPLVVQLFEQGALHLSAIKLLGPHLTRDNHVQLLDRASDKGKREIELLVAALSPKPDVPSRMRKLPELSRTLATPAPIAPHPAPSVLDAPIAAPPVAERQASQAPFVLEAPRPRASSVPLSPGRYKVELTAGQALHDKLEQLKDLLRHQVPSGDLAVIVELAVDLLVDKIVKQRCASTRAAKAPRSTQDPVRPPTVRSRYIPRAVVREVYARDGGQCTFVSADGRRCSERGFLELHHHDIPYARGGAPTAQNLRLVCRTHNALHAERDYGAPLMRFKQLQARERANRIASSGTSSRSEPACVRAPKRRPQQDQAKAQRGPQSGP